MIDSIGSRNDIEGNSVCFLNYDLAFGGTEKVIVSLANHFHFLGKKVTILILSEKNDFKDFLNPEISVICLNVRKMKYLTPKLSQFIINNNFDNFIANVWPLTSLSFVVRVFSKNTHLIYIEHCNLSEQFQARSAFFKFMQKLSISFFYKFANMIVTVSDGVKKDLINKGVLESKIKVIYNPVISEPVQQLTEHNLPAKHWLASNKKRLIAVGRFKAQKNFTNLVEAIYIAKNKLDLDLSLLLLGDGEEKEKILERVVALRLEENIFLAGWVSDPLPYFDLADLFVLSSDYEGFGVVIVEAMSRGLNIVSTNCKSGPSEILNNGEFGFLCEVDNPESLSHSIMSALNKPIPKDRLIQRSEDFSEKKIGNLYAEIIR
ncbi:glycosyltransferase [Pseudomonadota bacterium]|nr:glycosyltransferase [Pseudomonadota bacterium]